MPNGDVLALVPAGAEPEDEAATRRVVEHRRRLGQHRRMTERGRQDAHGRPTARDAVGERGHRRERLEARAAAVPRMSVRWSFIQTDSNTSCSPIRAHAASSVAQSTACGEVLIPIGMRRGSSRPRASPSGWPLIRGPVVTAPSDAEPTSAAYLASTPPA